MSEIYRILYLPLNAFMVLSVYLFMQYFFKAKKTNKNIEITTYIIYFIISSAVHLFIKIPIFNLMGNLLLIFALTFNYKDSLQKRILNALLIYIILALIEMMSVFINGQIYNSIFTTIENTSIISLVCGRILMVSLSYLLYRYNEKNEDGFKLGNKYFVLLISVPILTVILLAIIFYSAFFSSKMMTLIIMSILLINLIVLYLYDDLLILLNNELTNAIYKNQALYYEEQLKLIQENNQELKSLKHDMLNHLTTVALLIKSQECINAHEYIEVFTERLSFSDVISKSGNTVVDSILNYKLSKIKSNIALETNIKNIPQIDITSFDLSIILSNILDNAIEAAEKCNKGYLRIDIYYDKDSLIFVVKNSFVGHVRWVGGHLISTKKHTNDNVSHGIGLTNVRQVVEKYDGILDLSSKDQEFTATIIIYI